MSTTRKIFSFIGLPLLIVFAAVIVWAFQKSDTAAPNKEAGSSETSENSTEEVTKVTWSQSPNGWVPSSTPPECVDPFKIKTPTPSLSLATSILYPGQERGDDYKPHGGFRFDNSSNEDIKVIMPMDASLVNASRYLSSGEVQILLTFISPCGISFRFDHAGDLVPDIQKIIEKLPEATEGDSRTTNISPQLELKEGDLVANSVGIKKNKNVFFDFGMYDLRKETGFRTTAAKFLSDHKGDDNALNGFCWFDYLPSEDSKLVKSLPASGASGSTSDTCN